MILHHSTRKIHVENPASGHGFDKKPRFPSIQVCKFVKQKDMPFPGSANIKANQPELRFFNDRANPRSTFRIILP